MEAEHGQRNPPRGEGKGNRRSRPLAEIGWVMTLELQQMGSVCGSGGVGGGKLAI